MSIVYNGKKTTTKAAVLKADVETVAPGQYRGKILPVGHRFKFNGVVKIKQLANGSYTAQVPAWFRLLDPSKVDIKPVEIKHVARAKEEIKTVGSFSFGEMKPAPANKPAASNEEEVDAPAGLEPKKPVVEVKEEDKVPAGLGEALVSEDKTESPKPALGFPVI